MARRVVGVRGCRPIGLASLELADIDSDYQLVNNDAEPCGLGEGRSVNVETEAPDLDLDAIPGDVCDASQREVADALDGEAGEDSDDGEEDKGGEVEDDEDAEDEGGIQEGHVVVVAEDSDALPSACRFAICEHGVSGCWETLFRAIRGMAGGGVPHKALEGKGSHATYIHEQDLNCSIFH